MDLYTLTLKAIRTLLVEIDKTDYVPVVDECIDKWENEKNDIVIRDVDHGQQCHGTGDTGYGVAHTTGAAAAGNDVSG